MKVGANITAKNPIRRVPCKAAPLAAASVALLSGNPQYPGTPKNTTEFPELRRWGN
jgi:hypothetical protein